MGIKDLRREISPAKYKYLLIVDGKKLWLTIGQLEGRKEAVITRKAISLRLSNMFNDTRPNTEFKNVMDCISKPRNDSKRADENIDTTDVFNLMNKSLKSRK